MGLFGSAAREGVLEELLAETKRLREANDEIEVGGPLEDDGYEGALRDVEAWAKRQLQAAREGY